MFETGVDIWQFFSKLSIALVVAVLLVISGLGGIIFSLYYLFVTTNTAQASDQCNYSPSVEIIEKSIFVDVSGAVVDPGIYQLPIVPRAADAIEVAGGFNSDADQVYLAQNFNLARSLEDGEKLYIPFEGESLGATENKENAVSSLISINSASGAQLESLEGIGEKRAEEIISNRPYQSIDQLVSKEVLTETMLDKIRSQIQL